MIVTYEIATGESTGVLSVRGGAAELHVPEGEGWIEVPDGTPLPGYVVGGVYHPRPAQPSPAHHWNPVAHAWELDLAAQKDAAWERIRQARDAAENGASAFEWDGSVFDSSPMRIGGAFSAARAALELGIPFSVDWTLADNTVRTLSATEMVEVGFAQLAHVEALHTKARQLRAQIYAATSLAEIEAVTWQWP